MDDGQYTVRESNNNNNLNLNKLENLRTSTVIVASNSTVLSPNTARSNKSTSHSKAKYSIAHNTTSDRRFLNSTVLKVTSSVPVASVSKLSRVKTKLVFQGQSTLIGISSKSSKLGKPS